jgi:hypothetical protein
VFGADDQLGDRAVTSWLNTRKVLLLGHPGIVALHQFPRRGGVVRLQFDVSDHRLVPGSERKQLLLTRLKRMSLGRRPEHVSYDFVRDFLEERPPAQFGVGHRVDAGVQLEDESRHSRIVHVGTEY